MGDLNMAKAAAISFKEFRTRYNTEAACREELFRQRFLRLTRAVATSCALLS